MKLTVKVKTNAKVNAVEERPGGELRVLVKAPPQEGRANESVPIPINFRESEIGAVQVTLYEKKLRLGP